VACLAGRTSGKSFLEWTGGARWMLAGALAVLWVTSLHATFAERRGPRGRTWARAAGLALTAGAAIGLLRATRAAGYPPIDPTSGGPTGTSLLASTLALVALLLAIPRLAGLPLRGDGGGLHGAGRVGRVGGWWIGLLLAHGALCLRLGFGDRSNLEMAQIAGLASLLPWAGLVPWDWSRFAWPPATRGWRLAAMAWGLVLALSGVAQFSPAWLGPAKFTHGLVAHAHLAMAGFTSSVAFLVLESKRVASAPSLSPLGASPMFALWHLGTVFHVLALAGVGVMEVRDPAVFLRGATAVSVLLGVRWLAGAAMLAGAWIAWRRAGEAT
jgi:cytochrome c oxidase cbb3-type subunit 1